MRGGRIESATETDFQHEKVDGIGMEMDECSREKRFKGCELMA